MQTLNQHGHFWAYCGHCQRPIVICGNCGNNCCNGGSGEYADGSKCEICNDAYDFQDLGQGDNPMIDLIDRPEPTNPNRFILADRALTPEQREEEQRLLQELWGSDPFWEPEIKSVADLDPKTRASIERGIEQAKAGEGRYLGSFADE
jgi:hypothetical protein